MSLLGAAEYDLDTLDYLNRQERQVRQDAKNSVIEESPQENDDLVTNFDELKLKEMAEVVEAIEVREAAKKLLSYDGPSERLKLELEMELMSLTQAASRLHELSYLSNLLIKGESLCGESISAEDAAQIVMGTCNLAHEVYPELSINEEPVLIRLFKVGWHGIEQIPKQGLTALRQALSQLAVSNQDKGRKWVIQQVCDDLNRPSLDANVETRLFKALHDNLDLLSLIYDAETVSRLKQLINDTPCWSESSGLRFIRCQDDLKQVAKYLKDPAMR